MENILWFADVTAGVISSRRCADDILRERRDFVRLGGDMGSIL